MIIADDFEHWVEGIGNIIISTCIDGVINNVVIAKVFYIPIYLTSNNTCFQFVKLLAME